METTETKDLKLSAKENKLIQEIQSDLESSDAEKLKNSLEKLLSIYLKQLKRTEKVLAQSDKQQERMLDLNEKLEYIRYEQTRNISRLIEQKRISAKNIIENKKTIFEIHKRELRERQADIDELTQVIIQKDEALARLKIYIDENYRLKQELARRDSELPSKAKESYNQETLQSLVSVLSTKHNLEFDILRVVTNLLSGELDFSKINHDFFTQNGLRLIQKGLHTLLNGYDKSLPNAELSSYIIGGYLNDILSVCADKLMDLIVVKDARAINFVNFYDGQISVTKDGSRVEKPTIKSADGIKWNINSIYQVAFQYKSVTAKIREKEKYLKNLSNSLSDYDELANSIGLQLEDIRGEDAQTNAAMDELSQELELAQKEYARASDEDRDNLEIKIQKLSGSLRTLRLQAYGGRFINQDKLRELDSLNSKSLKTEREITSLRLSQDIESKRLDTLLGALEPLEKKYNDAVSALAKAMAQYELQFSEPKTF